MGAVLLGIDIGTSACKVVAFSEDGTVVSQTCAEYPVYYPRPGWAEQDPNEWWNAVCQGVKQLLTKGTVCASDIQGIGIDGQSWSAIPIDKDGQVLHNTPIWMDTRAADICKDLSERVDQEALFDLSGNPLQPSYTLPKILWYKQHRPSVYKNCYKILQSNGFVAYRLTGVLSQDRSQGYGLCCYDMREGQWNEGIASELGADPSLLPDLFPCHQVIGTVTEQAGRETGLLAGTPVVAGGLDAACGTLGAGVVVPGQAQEQGGQAGGMSICLDQYRADQRLILSNHVVPGLWLLQGGTVGGAGAFQWFEQEFGAQERLRARQNKTNAFQELDREAEKISPGSDGMVFLPYMAGERSPIWDPCAQGVYFGVGFSKTRAHFVRATLEGVALALRHNLEVAREIGADVDCLHAMGGAANSRLWTQIKANVTGKRIVVPSSDTATALGAALLAGVGTGVYADFQEAVRKTVKIRREHRPDPAQTKTYQKAFDTYLALYQALKPIMNQKGEYA